jgi:hypothetical protein
MNVTSVLALIVSAIVITGILISLIKSYLVNGIFITGGALILTTAIVIILNFTGNQKSVN